MKNQDQMGDQKLKLISQGDYVLNKWILEIIALKYRNGAFQRASMASPVYRKETFAGT